MDPSVYRHAVARDAANLVGFSAVVIAVACMLVFIGYMAGSFYGGDDMKDAFVRRIIDARGFEYFGYRYEVRRVD